DSQLREIRRRAGAELADGGAAPRSVVGRAAGGESDVGAGTAVPALAAGELPGGGRRHPRRDAAGSGNVSEPDSRAVAARRTAGAADRGGPPSADVTRPRPIYLKARKD